MANCRTCKKKLNERSYGVYCVNEKCADKGKVYPDMESAMSGEKKRSETKVNKSQEGVIQELRARLERLEAMVLDTADEKK